MQPASLRIERTAGKPCTFVVYYTRNGKLYLDGLYSATADEARDDFLGFAAEAGWKNVEVVRVEARA